MLVKWTMSNCALSGALLELPPANLFQSMKCLAGFTLGKKICRFYYPMFPTGGQKVKANRRLQIYPSLLRINVQIVVVMPKERQMFRILSWIRLGTFCAIPLSIKKIFPGTISASLAGFLLICILVERSIRFCTFYTAGF